MQVKECHLRKEGNHCNKFEQALKRTTKRTFKHPKLINKVKKPTNFRVVHGGPVKKAPLLFFIAIRRGIRQSSVENEKNVLLVERLIIYLLHVGGSKNLRMVSGALGRREARINNLQASGQSKRRQLL